jgi:hypothetical protein
MINRTKVISLFFLVLFALLSFTTSIYGGVKDNSKKKSINSKSITSSDSCRINVNNFNLPLNNAGVLADVAFGSGSNSRGGIFDSILCLFSGGFFLSGKDTQGNLWTNGVASASRILDYLPGPVGKDNNPKAKLYIVSSSDAPFSQSWQDWKDAVEMGANFYDGDNDGVYNPIDKNGNGIWDANEDRPDLIGDITTWCVYNDNVPASSRIFNDVNPQGIEVRQTVYAFNGNNGAKSNTIFIRYELENKGTNQTLDSVFFSAWADPDIGTPTNDVTGCDTLLSACFTYSFGVDPLYGSNPPAFLIDLLQGPATFIPGVTFIDANGNGIFDEGEAVLQNAYERNGIYRGTKTIPGAKNLGLSSFTHYINGDLTIGDPATQRDVRFYQLGLNRSGSYLDPCSWSFGHVYGVSCNIVNNIFWYSGDPVAIFGWINTTGRDQRNLLNTGPFKLEKNKPVSIVIGYVIGRNTNYLDCITKVKGYDKEIQNLFNRNFSAPQIPDPPVLISPGNNSGNQPLSLTLSWDTAEAATSYKLQIANNPSFESLVLNDSGLTNNSDNISGLNGLTKYYWRVSASNSHGESQYSDVFSFTTIPTSRPEAPLLISPANGATNIPTNVNFKWNTVPGCTKYGIQIAKDSAFTSIVVRDTNLTTPDKYVTDLSLGTVYFWRARAENIIGAGPYSNAWSFRSTYTGIENDQNAVPTEYAFYQNYPNPFNPSTLIKYDLPKEGFVTIKVYNILGEEVRTLVSDYKKAGSYSVSFNAASLPSGIYLCKIMSNDFTAVRKMLLMK